MIQIRCTQIETASEDLGQKQLLIKTIVRQKRRAIQGMILCFFFFRNFILSLPTSCSDFTTLSYTEAVFKKREEFPVKTYRKFKAVLAASVTALSLAGCSVKSDAASAESAQSTSGQIAVLAREEGSGTRGAFTELFKLAEDDKDLTKADAEITNSTAVMLTTVSQNPNAIGYISAGSLNDSVKAVSIDNVYPTVESVMDGSYTVSRPFLIAEKEGSDNKLAQDFKSYILSQSGQSIISDEGYVPIDADAVYEASGLSGKLTVGGSSSVTPVMEKLAEAYQKENPDIQVSVLQTDSTTGASGTVEGIYDIGMLSRDLKPEEESQGLESTVIARDGIAIIVNPSNSINELSKEQVKAVYTGEISDWSELLTDEN